MKSTLCLLVVVAEVVLFGCSTGRIDSASERQNVADKIIVGRVIDVVVLNKAEGELTLCHIDPRYVVSVQTEDRVWRLAIHSSAKAFMGADPVGKDYRFYLSASNTHYILEKVEEISP